MDTPAPSQANQVPRTPPPAPKFGNPTHQPSLSMELLSSHLPGLLVQHINGGEDRTGSDREIVHDKSSNRKTFLNKEAGGFVFGTESSGDSQSLSLRIISHDTVEHEDTTKDDDECAVTEHDNTSGQENYAISQRAHSTSSLTQQLLGSYDAQLYVVVNPKKIRKDIATTELPDELRSALLWERKDKRRTVDASSKQHARTVVEDLQIHSWDDSNWRGW